MIPNFKFAGTWDEMDVLARAQFFEGYLNVRPFGMIHGATGKSQLLKIMEKALTEIGGTPNPEWLSKGDTGLYRTAYAVVNRAVHSQKGERAVEAADILQSMMGLAGWEDEEGETLELGGKSPFWRAGKDVGAKQADKFIAGKLAPSDVAGLSVKFVYDRARDVIRQEADRAKKRHENQELIVDESMGTQEPEDEDWGQIIDALFSNPGNPVSKKFFGWLASQIPNFMRRGEGARLITNYLELLKAGIVRTDTEAAEALGSSSSALSNTKKVFTESMAGYLKHNPNAQEEMENMFSDAKFLHNLLRGKVRGDKVGALAKKIAARHLARLEKAAAKSFKFKRDLKLKSGITIPKDTPATVDFSDTEKKLNATGTAFASIMPDYSGLPLHPKVGIQAKIEGLHNYLEGFPKMPGFSSLERMVEKGTATTPMGERVEPDGYGPSGAPSWILVAGVI